MSAFTQLLWWLVLPAALLVGLGLFAIFGMFVASVRWEWKRDERLAELESAHHMKSQAECNERVALINQARAYGHGSPLAGMTHERLAAVEKQHQQAWDARVKEIVELKCPVPDETFEQLDAELRERGW